jgi:hypothetical protein
MVNFYNNKNMSKIKTLIVAFLAALAFTSCSEDEPAQMLWEVTATPTENVKAAFDPSFCYQIQITSDGDGGEVTLKCTNYKSLNLIDAPNGKEYVDADCHFAAKVTEPGVVKITLDKMPDGFKETKSILLIDGTEGKDTNTTTIDITRKP